MFPEGPPASTASLSVCFPSGTSSDDIVARCSQKCGEANPNGSCLATSLSLQVELFNAGRLITIAGDDFVRTRNSIRANSCTSDGNLGSNGHFLVKEEASEVQAQPGATVGVTFLDSSASAPITGHAQVFGGDCGLAECPIWIDLDLTPGNATIADEVSLHDAHLGEGLPITGTWKAVDNTIAIKPEAIKLLYRAIATLDDESKYTSATLIGSGAQSGRWNPLSGELTLDLSTASIQDEHQTLRLHLIAKAAGVVPRVVAGPDRSVECDPLVGLGHISLTDGGSVAYSPPFQSLRWQIGAFQSSSAVANLDLPLGTFEATLLGADSAGRTSFDSSRITVVDTTGPAFDAVAPVTKSVCSSQETVSFAPPNVHDCSPHSVVGVIVRANGQPVNVPLGAGVPATPGEYVIRWTGADAKGNSSSVEQTVAIVPSLWATSNVALEDRARVMAADGTPGDVLSTGVSGTYVGVEAKLRSIFSVGRVDLRDRSVATGDVTSAADVLRGHNVTIGGSPRPMTAVGRPTFPDSPTFVAGTANVFVEPDGVASLGTGSYRNVTVNSRATLSLAAGDYFIESLDVEPQAKLDLGASVRLIIKNSLIYRGEVRASQLPTLFFLGSGDVNLESSLSATIVAPNARVTFGAGSNLSYAGRVFARDIVLRPDVVFRCAQ